MQSARLHSAQLQGIYLDEVHLQGADLRLVFFDTASSLRDIFLTDKEHGSIRVADIRWGGVNLAVVKEWPEDMRLGDEQVAWRLNRAPLTLPNILGQPIDAPLPRNAKREDRREAAHRRHSELLNAFSDAVRANRQLATTMRDQGMSDQADCFAYRGNISQRQLYRIQDKHLRWFGSWLLDLVSGYGYKSLRSVATYLFVVALFGLAYWALGILTGHTLTWNEAGVVSLTAFHGRGFFAIAFQPGDPQAALAAIEAVIGLLIEITLIATFTQRFFAR